MCFLYTQVEYNRLGSAVARLQPGSRRSIQQTGGSAVARLQPGSRRAIQQTGGSAVARLQPGSRRVIQLTGLGSCMSAIQQTGLGSCTSENLKPKENQLFYSFKNELNV